VKQMRQVPEDAVFADMAEARRFNELMRNNKHWQEECQELAQKVVALGVPPGSKLLDLETGPGYLAIEVARLLQGTGCQIVGMDTSAIMLTLAAENAQREGVSGMLAWREGSPKTMPFADGEFSFVTSNDSLHHLDDPLPVFDEIARVLRDDGRCVVRDSKRQQSFFPRLLAWAIGIVIPSAFRAHYWNSLRSSYTADELRAILEHSRLTGWRIEEDFMELTVVKEV
jgi:ubiquinone/menaquinone biosynthesis C-methylase UbiE